MFFQRCRRRCELSYKELEDECEVRGGGGKADKEGPRRKQKMNGEGIVLMTMQERYEVRGRLGQGKEQQMSVSFAVMC